MNGYIIKAGNKYLTKALFWYEHESDQKAYVFSQVGVDALDVSDWDIKPTTLIPATYENGVVTVTGKPRQW